MLVQYWLQDECCPLSLHDALPMSVHDAKAVPLLVAVGVEEDDRRALADEGVQAELLQGIEVREALEEDEGGRDEPCLQVLDRKSTRLNSSQANISYDVSR